MKDCKSCGCCNYVKNGQARGKQRYRCKSCGYNFIEGDARVNAALPAKKALAVLLYSLSKACLLYTSPSPRDRTRSRMPSSA